MVKKIKDFFIGDKEFKIFAKGNTIHKQGDIMNIETERGNIKIENYHSIIPRNIVGWLSFFAIIAVFILLGTESTKQKNAANVNVDATQMLDTRYVSGYYNGLIRKDNSATAMQKLDCEFYVNADERNKKNYIRVLVYQSDYYFLNEEDCELQYMKDVCESLSIYLCTAYDCILTKKTANRWKFIDEERGIYVSAPSNSGEYDFVNTIVSNRENNIGEAEFILQKCLYVGNDVIIVIVLSHNGTYEDFMQDNSENSLKLKRCFKSLNQIHSSI